MFDLSRVLAAPSVGESIAELVRATADHLRGKSAVQWKPALDEIERAIPDVIAAIRSGTVAEDEDGSLANDGDRGPAAAAAGIDEGELADELDTAGDTTGLAGLVAGDGAVDPAALPTAVTDSERVDGAAGSDQELDARREREMGPTV